MLKVEQENFNAFFEAPFQAYGADSPYVSPLKSDLQRFFNRKSNPLFINYGDFTYFTVHQDSKVLGRICAHVHDKSNKIHQLSRGYFGFFDCVDDAQVSGLLLQSAEDWLRQRGLREIAGNFNLTAMQQMGVMTDGFELPVYTDQMHTPRHIYQHLEKNDYQRFFPMSTFELNLKEIDRLDFHSSSLSNSFRFESIKRFRFKKQTEDACLVLNRGFAKNPMFVPLDQEEFWFQTKEMLWIMDPHISLMAYSGDDPVGVVICIPDLNPFLQDISSRYGFSSIFSYAKHRFVRKRAVIIFYSVIPDFQGQGLNTLMLQHVISRLKNRGYEKLGVTWIADVNKGSLRQMEKLHGERLHRLHLYKKSLL